jgi:hypothetical protein
MFDVNKYILKVYNMRTLQTNYELYHLPETELDLRKAEQEVDELTESYYLSM